MPQLKMINASICYTRKTPACFMFYVIFWSQANERSVQGVRGLSPGGEIIICALRGFTTWKKGSSAAQNSFYQHNAKWL